MWASTCKDETSPCPMCRSTATWDNTPSLPEGLLKQVQNLKVEVADNLWWEVSKLLRMKQKELVAVLSRKSYGFLYRPSHTKADVIGLLVASYRYDNGILVTSDSAALA